MEELLKAIVKTGGDNPLFLLVVMFFAKDFYQQVGGRLRAQDDKALATALKGIADSSTHLGERIDHQTERIDKLAETLAEIRGRLG